MANIPSFEQFEKQLELVMTRVDETGFLRVWGYLTDNCGDAITFWRWRSGSGYEFKNTATYVGNRSLSSKIDEKTCPVRGYMELPRGDADWVKLAKCIYADYKKMLSGGRLHVARLAA